MHLLVFIIGVLGIADGLGNIIFYHFRKQYNANRFFQLGRLVRAVGGGILMWLGLAI